MGKKQPPLLPDKVNGDTEHLHDFMMHLNSRIDSLIWAMLAGFLAMMGVLIGLGVAILAQGS